MEQVQRGIQPRRLWAGTRQAPGDSQDQQGRLTQQRKQRSRGQHTFRMWSRLRQLFSRLRFLLVYIVTNRSVLPPRSRRQTHTHPVTLQLHSLDVVSYCCGCRTIHPCPCVCVWACQDDGCCGVGQNCSATPLTASPSCAADVDEILTALNLLLHSSHLCW